MSNKIKTKVKKKKLLLTREDFKKNLNIENINQLDRMFHTPTYTVKIKHLLYSMGKISAKGFLFNDNIYTLPLGKKNSKGEILIDSEILKLLDRFNLSEEFVDKSDTLTAFLIDHDDDFAALFRDMKPGEITQEAYVKHFQEAFTRVSNLLLNYNVSAIISEDAALVKALDAYNDKSNKLAKQDK